MVLGKSRGVFLAGLGLLVEVGGGLGFSHSVIVIKYIFIFLS